MKRQLAVVLALSSSFALLSGCAHTRGSSSTGGTGSAAPASSGAPRAPNAADDGDNPGTPATVIPGPAVIVPPPAEVVPPNEGSGAGAVNRVTIPRTTQARAVKVGAGERTDAGPPSPAGTDTNESGPEPRQDDRAQPPASGAPPAGGGSTGTQPGSDSGSENGPSNTGPPAPAPSPSGNPPPAIAPDFNIGQRQSPASPHDDTQSRVGGAGPSGGTGAQDRFRRLDLNGDGVLSPQEAQGDPQLSSDFAAADANRDGVVSSSEFSRFEDRARGH